MSDINIFNIIKKEKLNILKINTKDINIIFNKYYFKNMIYLKKKFSEIKDINFEHEIETIGNMLFHISWIILLKSFNIHITVFFMERASLLFGEFVTISMENLNYTFESNSKINDAILFTYKKTIGNIQLDKIFSKNKNLEKKSIYKDLLNVRKSCFLNKKIINIILKDSCFKKIESNLKLNNLISELLYNIYQLVDIDNFLFLKINKLLHEEKLNYSLNLIIIYIKIINTYLKKYYFNLEIDINIFLGYLDEKFEEFKNLDKPDREKNNINYLKEIVFRNFEI